MSPLVAATLAVWAARGMPDDDGEWVVGDPEQACRECVDDLGGIEVDPQHPLADGIAVAQEHGAADLEDGEWVAPRRCSLVAA